MSPSLQTRQPSPGLELDDGIPVYIYNMDHIHSVKGPLVTLIESRKSNLRQQFDGDESDLRKLFGGRKIALATGTYFRRSLSGRISLGGFVGHPARGADSLGIPPRADSLVIPLIGVL